MVARINHLKFLANVTEEKIVTKLDAMKVVIATEHQHSTSEKRYKRLIKALKILGFNEWEREEIYTQMNYNKMHEKFREFVDAPLDNKPSEATHAQATS